jgi:hypothetical protein
MLLIELRIDVPLTDIGMGRELTKHLRQFEPRQLTSTTTHRANVDGNILHTGRSAAPHMQSSEMSTICKHRIRVYRGNDCADIVLTAT